MRIPSVDRNTLIMSDEFRELIPTINEEFTTTLSCHFYRDAKHLGKPELPFNRLGREASIILVGGYRNTVNVSFEEDFWRNKFSLKTTSNFVLQFRDTVGFGGIAYQIKIRDKIYLLATQIIQSYIPAQDVLTISLSDTLMEFSIGEPLLGEATEGFIEWFS